MIAGQNPEPKGKPSPGPKIVFESSFAKTRSPTPMKSFRS